MRASSLRTLLHHLLFIRSLPLLSCNPLPSSPSPRNMPLTFCANDPDTLAGTVYIPSASGTALSLVTAAKIPTPWCAPHSKTYILITPSAGPITPQTSAAVQDILNATYGYISTYIADPRDRSMPADGRGVVWDQLGAYGVRLQVQNVNHEAISWGVLGAAVGALKGWMEGGGQMRWVEFEIVDGTKKVGVGRVL